MNTNLKTGKCPICSSLEIYNNISLPKRGERMTLVISSLNWFSLNTYICINCGHFEEFINKAELDDSIKQKIQSNWKKVEHRVQ